jgi:hypothetical protein
MALITVSYDLPTDPAQLQAYAAWAGMAGPRITAAPGMVWWQPFRTAQATSPQVISVLFMDSLAAAQRWEASADFAALLDEMQELGCTSIVVQVFDESPLIPEPQRP